MRCCFWLVGLLGLGLLLGLVVPARAYAHELSAPGAVEGQSGGRWELHRVDRYTAAGVDLGSTNPFCRLAWGALPASVSALYYRNNPPVDVYCWNIAGHAKTLPGLTHPNSGVAVYYCPVGWSPNTSVVRLGGVNPSLSADGYLLLSDRGSAPHCYPCVDRPKAVSGFHLPYVVLSVSSVLSTSHCGAYTGALGLWNPSVSQFVPQRTGTAGTALYHLDWAFTPERLSGVGLGGIPSGPGILTSAGLLCPAGLYPSPAGLSCLSAAPAVPGGSVLPAGSAGLQPFWASLRLCLRVRACWGLCCGNLCGFGLSRWCGSLRDGNIGFSAVEGLLGSSVGRAGVCRVWSLSL